MNDVASIKVVNANRMTVQNIEYFAKEIDNGTRLRFVVYQSSACNICMFKGMAACKVSKDNLLCLDNRADGKKIYWAKYHE